MVWARYHKTQIGNHALHPETLMLGYGYDPALSEGSVKPPVFLTSTFVFRTAEEGRDFFDITAGRREPAAEERTGLVYSRFNHPNLEIVEDRLAVYEKAEQGLVFSSGMAAIATAILAYVRPGDAILHSRPLYGGTEVLIDTQLAPFGIRSATFRDGLSETDMRAAAARAASGGRVAMIFIETPSNPMNSLVDIALVRRIADEIGSKQGSRGRSSPATTPCWARCSSRRSRTAPTCRSIRSPSMSAATAISSAAPSSGSRVKPQADPRVAQRHRHPARSAFVLDAEPLAGDIVAAHGARRHQCRQGGAVPVRASPGRARPLSAAAAARRSDAGADGAPIGLGRLDLLVRGQGRAGRGLRVPQPARRCSSSPSASAAPSR